ncbi:hypothetical protein LSTR_LSTR011560 [Laodelphax striatellus]|uniref:Uncharacterized protein n=1 Tax=Laodelphax striatellus TaxID=195883 RepID=A0A482X9T0_LAOST|nr:hypothetical protein LSTR_LSTR011560 [Laodelphax striatellus]
MESRSDIVQFIRKIIARMEEEERLASTPMVLSTPFVYYPPPTPAHPFCDQKEFLLALFFNNTERAEFLLKRGHVNINGSEWSQFNRPLHLAAEFGFVDLVKLLLRNGADPNIPNQLDDTPLQLAARRNQFEVVKLLLEAGAKPDSCNSSGLSAIQLAGSCTGPGDYVFNELRNRVTSQVVDILTQYVKKQKQSAEDELLNAFETRLRLSENKEQLKDELGNMVEELSSLTIENTDKPSTSTVSN